MGEPETVEEILTGESWTQYNSWLQTELRSESTRGQYLYHFTRFLEWLGHTTESLYRTHMEKIREAREDYNSRALGWLKVPLIEYQKHMRDDLGYFEEVENDDGELEKVATASIVVPRKALVAFFKSNSIQDLPLNGNIPITKGTISGISKSELRRLLEVTGDFRNKAIVHFGKDSGLRLSDISRIKIRDIKPALDDPEMEFFTWSLKTKKTRRVAKPCVGPNALLAVREWMKWRRENGISTEDDDFLFCNLKTRRGYTRTDGMEISQNTRGRKMTDGNMSVIIGQLVKKAGLADTGISANSLRKFHQTELEHSRAIPSNWINKLTGRVGTDTSLIYSMAEQGQLLKAYEKAYPSLSLEESGIAPEEFEELADRIKNLEKTNRFYLKRLQETQDPVATTKITHIDSGVDITGHLQDGYTVEQALKMEGVEADPDKESLSRENQELKAKIAQLENGAGEDKLREMILKMKEEGVI